MKHNIKINLIMVVLFLIAQFTGLYIVNHYIDHKATQETQAVQWKDLPYNLERPEVKNQSTSFIYIVAAILIGTLLFLAIIKYNKPVLIKVWFFITFWMALSISFNAFFASYLAAIIALMLTLMRMLKNNVIVHNLTEIFIYGGIAAIFVPILNVLYAFILLAVISVYDVIAVWKTKHMVKLAEFQVKSKVFAGLFISYGKKKESREIQAVKSKTIIKTPTAILGGGDIGFPLIFAGVVMKSLMLKETLLAGFLKTSIIPISAAIALFILLLRGDKNKYYPAMPFISAGCFVGYLIVLIL